MNRTDKEKLLDIAIEAMSIVRLASKDFEAANSGCIKARKFLDNALAAARLAVDNVTL